MLADGVAAVFESINNDYKPTGIVASVCNEFGIPHFMGHWTPEMKDYKRPFRQFTRNYFPSPNAFSRALADLVEDYDWKSFTVIYEDDYGLMRIHDVLQYHNIENGPVMVRKIDDGDDQMPMLKEIALYGETRILLDCRMDKIISILEQAKKVKLLEEYQNYIITTIDAHILDFSRVDGNRANITTFRLIDPESVDAETAIHDWKQDASKKKVSSDFSTEKIKVSEILSEHFGDPSDKISILKTSSALMYDAVKIFSSSLRDLSVIEDIEIAELDCTSPSKWPQGAKILQILDQV